MTERDHGGPEVLELASVPGFVVFDLPGVPSAAGGTRPAPDVSVAEVALLARAMTYKFAVLGAQVGGGVAREVTRRGGRVVAVSTLAGCIADSSGLDVERLLALRRVHGDACVGRYGRPAGPPSQVFTAADADVVVPGARPGTIDGRTAGSLPDGVRVVAPAANVPYTAQGADVLRLRGIVALPDFVCNAGAVIGYRSAPGATPDQVLAAVDAVISGLTLEALDHHGGPLAGACERAGRFLRGWWGEPPAPPFAPPG